MDAYWKTEQKCRKYTKLLSISYIIMLLFVFMALFILSIYFIFMGTFNPSALLLPYYMSVPFDTKTISGWYLLWFIQCMMSSTYAVCVLSTTSYFVCTCIYICTICEHFDLLFASLERDIEQIQDQNSNFIGLRHKALKCLHHAIEIHVKVYE